MLWIGVLIFLGGIRTATGATTAGSDRYSVDVAADTVNASSTTDPESNHTSTETPRLLPVIVSPQTPGIDAGLPTAPRAKLHYDREADEWISPKVWATVTALGAALTIVFLFYLGTDALVRWSGSPARRRRHNQAELLAKLNPPAAHVCAEHADLQKRWRHLKEQQEPIAEAAEERDGVELAVVEQPIVEKPAAGGQSVVEEPAVEQPASVEQPAVAESVVEEPVVEKPDEELAADTRV